jgi:hypothetical protein
MLVTGASWTSAACTCAPNTPDGTRLPRRCESAATKPSNTGIAVPGGAAFDHDGRLPFRVDA